MNTSSRRDGRAQTQLRLALLTLLKGEELPGGSKRPWSIYALAEIMSIGYQTEEIIVFYLTKRGLLKLIRGRFIPTTAAYRVALMDGEL
jgi:hypothetical protein